MPFQQNNPLSEEGESQTFFINPNQKPTRTRSSGDRVVLAGEEDQHERGWAGLGWAGLGGRVVFDD